MTRGAHPVAATAESEGPVLDLVTIVGVIVLFAIVAIIGRAVERL